MRNTKQRVVSVLVAAAVLIGVPSAAFASRVTDTVKSYTYVGVEGVSGVYKVYTVTTNSGKKYCVRASSLSSNDPKTQDFSEIIIRSGSTQQFGGYGSIAAGSSLQADVMDGRRPGLCQADIAYLIYVNM